MIKARQIAKYGHLDELSDIHESSQMMLVQRTVPSASKPFFAALSPHCFGVMGQIHHERAAAMIHQIIAPALPTAIVNHAYFTQWIDDMAQVCQGFCQLQGHDSAGFWLGTERSCGRYHVDNVPLRALVTYAGKGTEYLPDEAANRQAYEDGKPNAAIVEDHSAIRFVNTWDVAIFKGGPRGLLHRSPDVAKNEWSVMMRLDHPTFWDQFMPSAKRQPPHKSGSQHVK